MTRMGFSIDLERCVGCQACVIACKTEHGTPRNIHWMRVLENEEGEYPYARRTFTPVRCNHCANPPCVEACPTGAFVQRPDGVVIINADVCVGTMACLTACPYYVPVRFDGGDGYFGRKLTMYEETKHATFREGTAQKCNFCFERLDAGRPPACVEACPADALNFGDLDDPESAINGQLQQRRHVRPREELGTDPSLYYLVGHGGGSIGATDPQRTGQGRGVS
jgi:molybdopterin-containing oxidoreductase family iron-sulfur binding subunit